MFTLECVTPPILRRKPTPVFLSRVGDTVAVEEIDGYWQGLLDQGLVQIAEPSPSPEPEAAVVESPAPKAPARKRGK